MLTKIYSILPLFLQERNQFILHLGTYLTVDPILLFSNRWRRNEAAISGTYA